MKFDLTGVPGNLAERSHKIRSRILQWVGIPCGIGIGATKTLAKLANHVAKTAERKPGSYPDHMAQVCDLSVLTSHELEWTMPIRDWKAALNRFSIQSDDRMPSV